MDVKPLSVTQLNDYINDLLISDVLLSSFPVTGEVEDCRYNASKGYITFNLKDSKCSINCYIDKYLAANLRFEISDGMQLVIYGKINFYNVGARVSIYVNSVAPAGEGTLAAAFRLMKEKLEKEGLFDPAHKMPIPKFPKKIGVVTSRNGSVIHDIVDTTRRRSNLVDIIIYPSLVQGEGSAATICEGIRYLNENYPELDAIIVGRGGGSTEDLWTFNEESVARAIYASKIPIVSAVGHHDNRVISDEVADLCAGTPTAAAELLVPDLSGFRNRIENCNPAASYALLASKVEAFIHRCLNLKDNAYNAFFNKISNYSTRLNNLKLSLDALYPLDILKKGYAALQDSKGKWISSAGDVAPGDKLKILLSDGSVEVEAKKVTINEE